MLDMLIRGGTIVDGCGGVPYKGDLALQDGKIVAIAPSLEKTEAVQEIDASGRIVAPGFVDIHRHADLAIRESQQLSMAIVAYRLSHAPIPIKKGFFQQSVLLPAV